MCRPDIMYHTSVLAKFMSDPSPDCYKAAVQLMEYLYTTRQRKMYFSVYCVCVILQKYIQINHVARPALQNAE